MLRGAVSDDILDTYQTEREPHVRAVTEKGIEMGHLQTLRDPERAAERDRALLARRAESAAPEPMRFPDLAEGLFTRGADTGRGQLSVQGVVEDGARRDRLDEIVGGGFHLIVDETRVAALEGDRLLDDLTRAGVRVVVLGEWAAAHQTATVVRDVDGTYRAWFAELGCSAVVIRPDFNVYGTADGADAVAGLAVELLDTICGDRSPAETGADG
ncbi:hypothetical protein ACF064_34085 [Streptomyces sp. NPDC015492]|uniref:hypothetical protein n=1 Tax=Streptomyces sp. NPDC015492 TaxID=3364958 RepID=UPI0036F9A88A